MTTRRTVLLAILAGLCLAALTAILGVVVISVWWGKAGAAAGAAIAAFGVSIAQNRAGIAMGKDDQERSALTRSILTAGGRPPLVREMANPVSVGVHGAPRLAGAAQVPP